MGCGKGEYSVSLAKMFQILILGIDIKGSRIYSGAKIVELEELNNVIFIRTQIEYIESLLLTMKFMKFGLHFQILKLNIIEEERLTHPLMLEKYYILIPNGLVNLKTDSLFLHGYTLGLDKIV